MLEKLIKNWKNQSRDELISKFDFQCVKSQDIVLLYNSFAVSQLQSSSCSSIGISSSLMGVINQLVQSTAGNVIQIIRTLTSSLPAILSNTFFMSFKTDAINIVNQIFGNVINYANSFFNHVQNNSNTIANILIEQNDRYFSKFLMSQSPNLTACASKFSVTQFSTMAAQFSALSTASYDFNSNFFASFSTMISSSFSFSGSASSITSLFSNCLSSIAGILSCISSFVSLRFKYMWNVTYLFPNFR